jgi:twitching motility protein PilT
MTMEMMGLLKNLIEKNGSDLHLLAGLHPAFRIDGRLIPMTNYDRLTPQSAKELIYSVLNEYQKHNFEKNPESRGELDFALGVSGLGRFRFNIHLQRGTVAATVRALSGHIPKLEDLGLPESVADFAKAKKGLVLVTGPTGCGKSTTLAALIDIINRTREDHIITVEDPIEYLHNSKKSYVTQREVGVSGDTLTFKNALKYALRQDPDVILIGEMRDYETMGIAITSAETGHLVFGTLHTSSAAKTINRIIDVFPSEQQSQIRAQLSSNLIGVISQILIPRIDNAGRVVACEVMKANAAVKNNIRTGKTEAINQTIQTSASEGMITMDQSLSQLIKERKIDLNTARPFIHDKAIMESLKQYQTAFQPTHKVASKNPAWDRIKS